MSPPVIVGYLGVYDVRQMSELCKIPPHKIHQYYDIYAQLYADPVFSFWNYLCHFCVNTSAENKRRFPRNKEHYSGLRKRNLMRKRCVSIHKRQ